MEALGSPNRMGGMWDVECVMCVGGMWDGGWAGPIIRKSVIILLP